MSASCIFCCASTAIESSVFWRINSTATRAKSKSRALGDDDDVADAEGSEVVAVVVGAATIMPFDVITPPFSWAAGKRGARVGTGSIFCRGLSMRDRRSTFPENVTRLFSSEHERPPSEKAERTEGGSSEIEKLEEDVVKSLGMPVPTVALLNEPMSSAAQLETELSGVPHDVPINPLTQTQRQEFADTREVPPFSQG